MGRLSELVVWLRSLPRKAVLATCAALLGLTQTVLALLEAPVWVRIAAACLIAVVAGLSEIDKHRTSQLEKAAAKLETQKAAALAEQRPQSKVPGRLRRNRVPVLFSTATRPAPQPG